METTRKRQDNETSKEFLPTDKKMNGFTFDIEVEHSLL